MSEKRYLGIKKLWDDLYKGIDKEWDYHKVGWIDSRDEMFDKYEIGKEFYKEGFKKFKGKTGENIGKIIAFPAGTLTVLTAYRGLSDVFDYECILPILSKLQPGECKKYALSLFALFIGAIYHDSKMKRGRGERASLERLVEELTKANEHHEEEHRVEIKKRGKQHAQREREYQKSLKETKEKVDALCQQIEYQNLEMEKIREENAAIRKNNKAQLKLLEKISKQHEKKNKN
ncbi:MAG: hypothetical protein GTN38_02650 [Candidatus Aenigmarchaeota archaeon]|nr:hypothetical protein [Candidatus Aenigmarchaeota archaeon]NIP40536.1 hypothetical protein [Candidatus Aenigmarchaeota archaeon]NIQ18381.1 hypothetical protein [Candidatus Aenigmarchaeota archaeon]